MTTVTLTEFLLARIAEDEADARAADEVRLWTLSQAGDRIINDAGFMQRFTPSRVLAECEAKRQIIERHSGCDDVSYGDASTCPDMRDLVSVYADHPDFREEWRP
jgi:hypothetical protein